MLSQLAIWIVSLVLFDLVLLLPLFASVSWELWVAPTLKDRRARRRAIDELTSIPARSIAARELKSERR